MTRHQKRRRLATWISHLLGWNAAKKARLARSINAEPLEKRELMASDAFTALLGSAQQVDTSSLLSGVASVIGFKRFPKWRPFNGELPTTWLHSLKQLQNNY
ncbi:MAG: hypothetical protein U0930_19460 [Pirellulales bacterium]